MFNFFPKPHLSGPISRPTFRSGRQSRRLARVLSSFARTQSCRRIRSWLWVEKASVKRRRVARRTRPISNARPPPKDISRSIDRGAGDCITGARDAIHRARGIRRTLR